MVVIATWPGMYKGFDIIKSWDILFVRLLLYNDCLYLRALLPYTEHCHSLPPYTEDCSILVMCDV